MGDLSREHAFGRLSQRAFVVRHPAAVQLAGQEGATEQQHRKQHGPLDGTPRPTIRVHVPRVPSAALQRIQPLAPDHRIPLQQFVVRDAAFEERVAVACGIE